MQVAMDQFRANIERVHNLSSLTNVLTAQTTGALDLSDILRAELVLAVSAFDHYVHELVRLGMLETYNGNRQQSRAFMKFQISMANFAQGINDPSKDDWFDEEIRLRHGYQSFQNPDHIAAAIRLISDAELWNEIAHRMGSDPAGTRERLSIIVHRRNQIAHEADVNPSYPMMRWPIDEGIVGDAVEFIQRIAVAIHDVVV